MSKKNRNAAETCYSTLNDDNNNYNYTTLSYTDVDNTSWADDTSWLFTPSSYTENKFSEYIKNKHPVVKFLDLIINKLITLTNFIESHTKAYKELLGVDKP